MATAGTGTTPGGSRRDAAGRPVARPTRARLSVERRRTADGQLRLYARYTDAHGQRVPVVAAEGGKNVTDWGEPFTAACTAPGEASRYRSRDGDKLLFRDLVARHYRPALADAAPNTVKNTASHLGDGTGVPRCEGRY